MGWIYLLLGGLFEIRLACRYETGADNGITFSLSFGSCHFDALSGYFLYLAQRTIPIGTAYVVWTGIGAVGTLLIGIFIFGDSAGIWRILSAMLVICGIIGIKLAS